MARRNNEELRIAYAALQSRAISEHVGMTASIYNGMVKKVLSDKGLKATPGNFVAVAEKLHIPCGRCAGTGAFITYVENGVPKGPGGICFRCGGKGSQDDSDRRRNFGYDMHGGRALV